MTGSEITVQLVACHGRGNAAAWWLLAGVLAFALAVRIAIGVHFDGLDDVGYLEAADRVASGRGTSGLGSLFHLRVGMAYPLGWLSDRFHPLRITITAPASRLKATRRIA